MGCSPIIRIPDSMKLKHPGLLIPMVGILRVTKGEYALSNYIDVEMEVQVRKYEVDTERLKVLLKSHKRLSTGEIAQALDRPETLVAHWFRQDKYFAIPDADIWHELKTLLDIHTDEFDKQITEFEYKGGCYDMKNRIYYGSISPTLTSECGTALHLIEYER